MKKVFVAILALLYISSSTGATIYLHYCMGKFAGADFSHTVSRTCAKCGMEKKGHTSKDCCKDENKFFKIQTDQDVSVSVYHLSQPVALASLSRYENAAADFVTVTTEKPISHSPPQPNSVAVYIRNCVYLL